MHIHILRGFVGGEIYEFIFVINQLFCQFSEAAERVECVSREREREYESFMKDYNLISKTPGK